MDIFSLLMNAKIEDLDNYPIGAVAGIAFADSRLTLIVAPYGENPDDGEKEPVPTDETGVHLKVVSSGSG